MEQFYLTNLETNLLEFLDKARYATSRQLASLFFTSSTNPATQLRRANFTLMKLTNQGLLHRLDRRIGGVRAGSGSFVYGITLKGLKILKQQDEAVILRYKNTYEPSLGHLEHTLAVTQLYLEAVQLDRREVTVKLERFDFKPKSWRGYSTIAGTGSTLKPDAYLQLTNGSFEDSYFIELDRNTESLARIVNKCKQYIAYYRTGIDQRQNEVFPFVLWVVPDDNRKQALAKVIQADLYNDWELFSVVTLDEFSSHLKGGQA